MLGLYEDKTSQEIVKFLRLQMALHHPMGTRVSDEDGAFMHDRGVWRKQLASIYSNLVDTTIHNMYRSNKNKANKNYSLRSDIVDLSADVANQLFFDGTNSDSQSAVEITQIVRQEVTQIEEDDSNENPAKRRKLEMNFTDSILNSIKNCKVKTKQEDSAIPWLQILARLMAKFPQTLASADLLDRTCQILLDCLRDCKSTNTKSELLNACNELVKADSRQELKPSVVIQLWDFTVNTVSLNHCVENGNRLLQSLIRYRCQDTEVIQKIYLLFTSKLVKQNEHSVRTLVTLIAFCPRLPEFKGNQVPKSAFCCSQE